MNVVDLGTIVQTAKLDHGLYKLDAPRYGCEVVLDGDTITVTIGGLIIFRMTRCPQVELIDNRRSNK